jgi:predicted Zn finger-like uncharacterized protein
MRLTCPNCNAQYEVDAAVIPDTGRDVQCSSCGTTWFQEPEGQQSTGTATRAEAAEAAAADAPEAAPKAPEPGLRQRTLDEAVVNVLREEAARETDARRAEHALLEEQTELGLGDAAPAAVAAAVAGTVAAAAAVPSAGQDAAEAEDHLVTRNMRRDLLPDIEEINSTLRASSDRQGDPAARDVPETLSQRRNGFRRGFLGAVAVMALALVPYLLSDMIAARVPSLAPVIAGYSGAIDGLRSWLDGHMKSTTDSLRPAASSSSTP